MEKVWGPVNGFYVAAYAAPASDGGRFCSYAKVCWSKPASYWEADCVFKLFGGEYHGSLESALASVAAEAQRQIQRVPAQAAQFGAQLRRDRRPLPRLFVNAFCRPRMA
jgi:hypothetical protein